VEVLAHKQLPPVEYTVTWDLRDAGGDPLSAGLYFVRLDFEGQERVRRLAVVR